MRGAEPSRSPAEGSLHARGAPSRSPAEGSHTELRKPIISLDLAPTNVQLVQNATTSTLEATSAQKRPEGVFDFNPKGGVECPPAASNQELLWNTVQPS